MNRLPCFSPARALAVPFAASLLLGGVAALFPPRLDAAPADPATVHEFRIDPASTGVPFGKARLTVEPLQRVPGKDSLSASYKVDVTPFTSKSEAGRFSVTLSDAALRQLAGGTTARFDGQAVSSDGTNTSTVQGRADPSGPDGGALRIQVVGKKGKLVFHTTYHLGH